MGLSAPWADYKNKQLFTNMKMKQKTLLCKKLFWQGINPMVLCAPLADYKNKEFSANTKIKQTTLRYNTKLLQSVNPMVLCAPWANTYLHNCKIEEIEELP